MGKKIILFCGGEVLDYEALRPELPNATILAADSGYRHCTALGITPDLLVGDFDSIKTMPQGVNTLPLPANKNYSDSFFAVQQALERNAGEIVLVGALGGARPDHALANVALLVDIQRKGVPCKMTDGVSEIHPVVCPINTSYHAASFANKFGHYFSLLGFSNVCHSVTIRGGLYPLDNYDLLNTDPRAISNEFIGVAVTVILKSGSLLFVTTPKYT